MSFRTLFIFLTLCSVAMAEINSHLIEVDSEVSGRKDHKIKHHIPYKVLLFHYIHGAVIALVIVKIILAMTFVGMVSALIKMFAAIKFLFQDTNTAKEAQKVYVPQIQHSHEIEYDFPGPPSDYDGYKYHHRRREDMKNNRVNDDFWNAYYQNRNRNFFKDSTSGSYGSNYRHDLSGGRNLGSDDLAYAVQIKENKERRVRELQRELNNDGVDIQDLNKRSAEKGDENCMKKRICLIHAKAKENPIYTFQLYFVKKDGLAQYWDHDSSKTTQDCIKDFPCDQNEGEETEKEKPKPTTEIANTTAGKKVTENRADSDSREDSEESGGLSDSDSDENISDSKEDLTDDDDDTIS